MFESLPSDRVEEISRVVPSVDCMFALIDSADLLLDPVSAVREANFDLVDIFGDSLNVEDI